MNERIIKLAASQIPSDAKLFTAKLSSHVVELIAKQIPEAATSFTATHSADDTDPETALFDITVCGKELSPKLWGLGEVRLLSYLTGKQPIIEAVHYYPSDSIRGAYNYK